MTFVRRAQLLALAAGLPAVVTAVALLWRSPSDLWLRVGLTAVVVAAWLGFTRRLGRQIGYPLQTIANLLAALRENDFSIRARGADADDALGTVMLEVNALSDTLRTQRLGAQEATALLRAVMAEIDVAILAFDDEQRLVLINRYGERLLDRPAAEVQGLHADALGLASALDAAAGVQDITFPGASGRWEVRHRRFWQGGAAHDLLVLADVSQPLRAQEREAWLRLIRVIGHELNNSLAPIKSIAGSLEALLTRTPPPDDWRADMQRGLSIIASRAEALGRFTTAYAQLARLPAPTRRPVRLGPVLHRVASLDTRLRVTVIDGEDITVPADADQLEQLLINLLRNAVDAALETGGGVRAGWTVNGGTLDIWIDDEGPGLQGTTNLFVPFFTTKAGGSGIGLVLSRQIAEAHGGSLTLANREDGRGARATIVVPLDTLDSPRS